MGRCFCRGDRNGMLILFNANQNTLARDLCSIAGMCSLAEMMDPREMTGGKADVQWVSVN